MDERNKMRYKCGHKIRGVVILDSDVLSIAAYEDWAHTVGIFGDKTKCWECWCKE